MEPYNNFSTSLQNGLDELSNPTAYGLLFFIIIIILTSLVGNTVILFTLYKTPLLRSVSSFLVANLAFNDMCISIFILPTMAIVIVQRGWKLNSHLCTAVGFLDAIFNKAQVTALLCIGINRFIAVHQPAFYSSPKNKRFSTGCVIIGWFYSLAWSLPPLFGLGEYSYTENQLFCGLVYNKRTIFETMNISATAILPGIAGLVIYSSVLVGVFRHIRQVNMSLDNDVIELKEVNGKSVNGDAQNKEVRIE